MKGDVFASIIFCENVQENNNSYDINGVFSRSESNNNDPFTIVINSTVYGEMQNVNMKSLYYVLEARTKNRRRYKLLKEVPLGTLEVSKDEVLHDNTAFVFDNRIIVSEVGEYFVRVYLADRDTKTAEVVRGKFGKLINSQVLIVE